MPTNGTGRHGGKCPLDERGHNCTVVALSLIPKKSGGRIKTNRRDAMTLPRPLRAAELTAVRVPDATHEAVRDLVRARAAAAQDLRRKSQQLPSFLLRHGRLFEHLRTLKTVMSVGPQEKS